MTAARTLHAPRPPRTRPGLPARRGAHGVLGALLLLTAAGTAWAQAPGAGRQGTAPPAGRPPAPTTPASPGPPPPALQAPGAPAAPPVARSTEEGRVVDRVVAVVEDALVTLSELTFEARVLLVQRAGPQAAQAPVDEALLRSVLELSIAQRLQVREAERLGAFALEQAERQALVDAFRARFPAPASLDAFLEAHGADVLQLGALLERGARAERALDSRLRVRVQVTEAEVRRHYERQAAALGGRPYTEVRERLRDELVRARSRAAAAEEVALLARGARIRRVAPFAREEGR